MISSSSVISCALTTRQQRTFASARSSQNRTSRGYTTRLLHEVLGDSRHEVVLVGARGDVLRPWRPRPSRQQNADMQSSHHTRHPRAALRTSLKTVR